MNDTCCLIAGGLKRLIQTTVAEGSWVVLAKFEPKPIGSQGELAKEKAKPIATKAQTLKDLSVTQRIMSARRKDKMGVLNVLGGIERSHVWGQPKQLADLV